MTKLASPDRPGSCEAADVHGSSGGSGTVPLCRDAWPQLGHNRCRTSADVGGRRRTADASEQGERNVGGRRRTVAYARRRPHNPSVAGSSPARPTSLSQWHPHQQVEQQEHAHDQGADESAFDRGSQSVRQMFPPIQESLPPFVFAKSQKIFHVASPAESGLYLRIGEDARPLQSSTRSRHAAGLWS
jgi:hypothetical protein